ncbi:hypothetical protein BaRGS_00031437 [Batillaria attramentaria]|uniref:Uncharacterized protein n=1 Tax=Batillaria attramentaria TaxID=370345 RepID=A0ABD0JRH7_9CAEN
MSGSRCRKLTDGQTEGDVTLSCPLKDRNPIIMIMAGDKSPQSHHALGYSTLGYFTLAYFRTRLIAWPQLTHSRPVDHRCLSVELQYTLVE